MDKIRKAAELLLQKKNAAVLTGSGISVDSGIPSFRSPRGIWAQYPPKEYAFLKQFKKDPVKLWRFFNRLADEYGHARPNTGHFALAELERMGIIRSVATQNIDSLHQGAGSRDVLELHGNNRLLRCIFCGNVYEKNHPPEVTDRIPYCACGKILKPDFIMFGESLPDQAMNKAFQEAKQASIYIIAGTSADVAPANRLPYRAKSRGALIIEINTGQTDLTHTIVDIRLRGSTSVILPRLVEEIQSLQSSG